MRPSRFALSSALVFASLVPACGSSETAPDGRDMALGDGGIPDGAGESRFEFGGLHDGSVIGGPQHTAISVASDHAVARVELYLDTSRIGEAQFAPWEIDWTTLPFGQGNHTLRAVAYDGDGAHVEGAIDVVLDNTPPVVGWVGSATVGMPLHIPVSDNVGIARVEVGVNGNVHAATIDATGVTLAWDYGCQMPVTVSVRAVDLAGWQGEQQMLVSTIDPSDRDCDGFMAIAAGGDDCNDHNASAHPGAPDWTTAAEDLNCDGSPGVDADFDGQPSTLSGGTDCNDGDATILRRSLTWGARPLVDAQGQPITWTRGNAEMLYDPTSQTARLAIAHGGTLDLVSIDASGAVSVAPLATGVTDAPMAFTMSDQQYVLAYVKGTALRVRRWNRGGDPTAGLVDDTVFTATSAIHAPTVAFGAEGLLVAARAGNSIWVGRQHAGGWQAGAVVSGLYVDTGAVAIDDAMLTYQDYPAGQSGELRTSAILWSDTPSVAWPQYLYGMGALSALFQRNNDWYAGEFGSIGVLTSSGWGGWTRKFFIAVSSWILERVVRDSGNHALAIGTDSNGANRGLRRVNLDTGNSVPLDASLPDGDAAAATDTLGHWIVAVPGTYYVVIAGDVDPVDGVDRDCDGED